MSLDGLRAWIGEVERKLGKRTRVFLALCAIAIGIAGAAIYLALDARSDSVSESDVQELQQKLEAQGAGGADLVQLEAEVQSLQAEVDRLSGDGGGSGQREGGSNQGRGGGSGDGGGASGEDGGSDSGSTAAPGGVVPERGDPARLQELLERAKEQSEANE